MEIVFVRHGVPDFSLADAREMTQLEKDYAPLSREHASTLKEQLMHPIFDDADIIVSSPYTRALQTAELINRHRGLELFVEHDLREWRADRHGGYIPLKERDQRWHEYRALLKAELPMTDERYEHVDELKARVEAVLTQFKQYKKVIVVSHFNVFEALQGFQHEALSCGEFRVIYW
ncbi:Histidine phosphatase superfamily (branch 1) [Vibrio sp. B1REV9]|uniref:histidine phosphatase family protein n=1 Tax=Vibrio sp. B1REV9 TaxID=2751179 RepID=UPI001AF107BE|nr:histidine phosphatase family protein [Vibrio sp. B1REV9]CAE6926711.1 Histidine phosphatase superfamily (branch 1) [Vibrio sp. B1REV9]